MNRWTMQLAFLVCALGLVACSSGSPDGRDANEKGAGTGDDVSLENARGDQSCHAWQRAIIGFAEQCSGNADAIAAYKDQAPFITCVSDQQADECARALEAAGCGAPPPKGCDLTEMADTKAADALCEQFTSAFCDLDERCSDESKEECLAKPNIAGLCHGLLGVSPELDTCLSSLSSQSCSQGGSIPGCDNIFLK